MEKITKGGGTCPNTSKDKQNLEIEALLEVMEVTSAHNLGRRSALLACEPMTSSIDPAQKPCHCCASSHIPNLRGKSYLSLSSLFKEWMSSACVSFQCWVHSHETLASVRKSTSASRVALVWACAARSSAKSDNARSYSCLSVRRLCMWWRCRLGALSLVRRGRCWRCSRVVQEAYVEAIAHMLVS